MPLKSYGVYRGDVKSYTFDPTTDSSPHCYINLDIGTGTTKQVAFNVMSVKNPPELLALVKAIPQGTFTQGLLNLRKGFTALASTSSTHLHCVDYVRQGWFHPTEFKPLPYQDNITATSSNWLLWDLKEKLDWFLTLNKDYPSICEVFVFGEPYTDGKGIHDVHMNQGNDGNFKKDNGTWQDGAMLLYVNLPAQNGGPVWFGFFTLFQTQTWNTDENGDPRANTGPTVPTPTNPIPTTPTTTPSADAKAIVVHSAIVNGPPGDGREIETVTLRNTGATPVALAGLIIEDAHGRQFQFPSSQGPLAGNANYSVSFTKPTEPMLSNSGGSIRLRQSNGALITEVTYTKAVVGNDGYVVTF